MTQLAPVNVAETSKTLLLPSWVKLPVTLQVLPSDPEKLMLSPLPAEANVRSSNTALPLMVPSDSAVMEPLRAVGALLSGENGAAENFPAVVPVKVPEMAVFEATLPLAVSVTAMLLPGGTLPGSA